MLPDGRQRAFRWFSRMKEDRHYHISHSSTPLVRRTVSARIDILPEFFLIRLFGVRKLACAFLHQASFANPRRQQAKYCCSQLR
jgi:hypothetical protein